MAKRGAISKLSPEVTASIIATLEKGNTRSCAAYSAGSSLLGCRKIAINPSGESRKKTEGSDEDLAEDRSRQE